MKKAAVVIGVNKTGDLPLLSAAASGAQDFASWATGQSYEVELLTDDGGHEVSLHDVKKALRSIVNARTYEQLVVFFAGHGILASPENERWLLSGAPDDPDEAVDLLSSVSMARNCGVPHVVIVSDACRSRPETARLHQVLGGSIFPNRARTSGGPEVDIFYASLPGDPALEAPANETTSDYKGIFTECLIKGLEGKDASVVEPSSGSPTGFVVPSWKLKPFLESEVPVAASRIHIKLQQDPEIRVESHPPKYLAEVAPLPGGPPPAPEAAPTTRAVDTLRTFDFFESVATRSADVERIEKEAAIDSAVDRVFETRGRPSFETGAGFTVVGASVDTAIVHSFRPDAQMTELRDIFPDPDTAGATHIRVYPERNAGGSILIRFEDGTGTCLAVLPDFVGTVLVEKGRVVNVNYTPVPASGRYGEYTHRQEEIERRRAFVAVAARNGAFRIERNRADEYGDFLRWGKALDPTLGLYAAYAYAQAGLNDQVRSVWQYMSWDELPIPFDVALLAGELPAGPLTDPSTRVRPICPMFSQGWSMLRLRDSGVSAEVEKASRHLVPALWTTFTPDGVELIADALTQELPGDDAAQQTRRA